MEGFNHLEFHVRYDIIRNKSLPVCKLDYFNYEVRLYSWNRYFIEEYFEKEERKITRISLVSDKDLLKFIRNICISELGFNCLS